VSELKVFDAADYIKDADDLMLYLRLTLSENDPISLADALNVILRSDGVNKLMETLRLLRMLGMSPHLGK
jgi:DNA-binding phage protein